MAEMDRPKPAVPPEPDPHCREPRMPWPVMAFLIAVVWLGFELGPKAIAVMAWIIAIPAFVLFVLAFAAAIRWWLTRPCR